MGSLKDVLKKGSNTRVTLSSEEKPKTEIPKGATITSKRKNIRTEQIENGWLLIEDIDIEYSTKDSKYNYANITRKFYTEDDPLDIKINVKDKGLADEFDD